MSIFMEIINLEKKEQLNKFVAAEKNSQFLQSWQWGEFHKKMSGGVFRLGVLEDNELLATATIIKKSLPMGKYYFYCPRGPVLKKDSKVRAEELLNLLFEKISNLAKDEGVMFMRFDPPASILNLDLTMQKTIDVQPSQTLALDLTKNKEMLLKEMHSKTRYNIRLAKKRGVKIIEAGFEKFEDFWHLMGETSNRDDFRLHGKDYYEAMIRLDPNFIKLFFAIYKGESIATSLVSFFGDTATYMHGGSSSEFRNVMSPYFLQWRAINNAKDKGHKYYDFYGIDEFKWPGVTRFKKGFGGRELNYPGTFDLIFDQGWYQVYKMVRRVRRTF